LSIGRPIEIPRTTKFGGSSGRGLTGPRGMCIDAE
jgi:hypothetical protein